MPQWDFRQNSTPLSHRIFEKLELPEDICRNCSYIELVSNHCALIDGCKSIMEYNDSVIKLNLGKKCVKFSGCNLTIRSLSLEQAVIEGVIADIEFI